MRPGCGQRAREGEAREALGLGFWNHVLYHNALSQERKSLCRSQVGYCDPPEIFQVFKFAARGTKFRASVPSNAFQNSLMVERARGRGVDRPTCLQHLAQMLKPDRHKYE